MPRAGIEPARYCYHWCLRPARLPIPPPGHGGAAGAGLARQQRFHVGPQLGVAAAGLVQKRSTIGGLDLTWPEPEEGIEGVVVEFDHVFDEMVVFGVFAAYIAGHALGPGAHYLAVFRFVGATAFMCHTVAGWSNSIWYKRAWSTTAKNTFDGLVYACLTAGIFGWLWPA